MSRKFKKLISLFLAIALVFTIVPISSLVQASEVGDSSVLNQSSDPNNSEPNSSEPSYRDDRVIIQLVDTPFTEAIALYSDYTEDANAPQSVESIKAILNIGFDFSKMRMINATMNAEPDGTYRIGGGRNDTFDIYLKNITVDNAMAILKENPLVKSVWPSYIDETYNIQDDTSSVTPNDPYYDAQWALKQIQAPEAWGIDPINADESDVVVGVIDTGIDGTHPDLGNPNLPKNATELTNALTTNPNIAGNLWINPYHDMQLNTKYPQYVNDIYGYDFVRKEGGVPYSFGFHGTCVNGVIGAANNNEVGISGVSQHVKLAWLGCGDKNNIINNAENIDTDAATEAFYYCADRHIPIVNCSWGGPTYRDELYNAIEYYINSGGLVICAAGNILKNNDINPDYPSCYDLPNIISVAATNERDDFDYSLSTSNFGATSVDIAAPGENILTTYPTNLCNDKMVVAFNYQDGDKCVTFDEVNEMLKQKENPDNRNGYQGSPLKSIGRSGDTELFTKTQ